MAEYYRFVDGVSYTEAQYMEYQKRLMSKNGVVANENLESSTSELEVIAATPNAMSVLVGTGECFVQGEFYQNTAAKTVTISAADASWNRYDRIVVGVDWSANTCGPYVVEGTAAESPTIPALTQTAAKWEIPIATVLVSAAVTDISGNEQTAITDNRYWAACNLGQFYIDTSGNLQTDGVRKITNLADPTLPQDAATRAYVLTNPGLPALESGKYLTSDGATLSWGTVVSFSSLAASDNLLASSDAEVTTTSTTYVLLKRIQIPAHIVTDGVARIKFDIRNGDNSSTVYGRIYVNGIAIGTEQSTTSSSATTKSEDITLTGIGGGAFLELWGAVNADTCKLTNFRIYGTETTGASSVW